MTTKGQMKPTSWQDEFNSIPGWREQPIQWPQTYDSIQYSYRPDHQNKSQKKGSIVRTIIEQVKKQRSSNVFQNSKSTNDSINSNINLGLGFPEIKTKQLSLIHWTHWSKSFAEKSMNQTASIWNIESPLAWSKLLTKCQADLTMIRTIPFNSKTSLRIRTQENTELL